MSGGLIINQWRRNLELLLADHGCRDTLNILFETVYYQEMLLRR